MIDFETIVNKSIEADELREELENKTNELQLSNRVHFLGFRQDILNILNCADVFVFPSKREGLPVALMEAMPSGLPCIVSKIRGNVDLVGEDYQYFFSPEDEVSLAEKMKAISRDQADTGELCRKRIEKYDLNNCISELESLYTEEGLRDIWGG